MRSFMFTEAEFKAAVIKSHKAFMDSLPKPEDCPEHEFSQQFILKMQRLFALDRRRRRFRSIRRNVAAVFLTILIGLSAWLAVDTDARAAAIRWVKEFFNEFIVYRITDEDETQDMPNFVLSWMPEDIGLVSYLEDETHSSAYYSDGEETINTQIAITS